MKFKIGDKVVPIKKSMVGDLIDSVVWNQAREKNQPFLYITTLNNGWYTCSLENVSGDGDYFKENDLMPFIEFNINDYYNRVVPCSTQEIWDTVLDICRVSGCLVSGNYDWNTYGSDSAIKIAYQPSYSYIDWYVNNYSIIPSEAFINDYKQSKMLDRPEIFRINGKPNQIKSIMVDLTEIGYSFIGSGEGSIISNNPNYTSIEEYKVLFSNYILNSNRDAKVFELPFDYSKALDFAKAQIESQYFKNVLEHKMDIGSKNEEIIINSEGVLVRDGLITIQSIRELYNKFSFLPVADLTSYDAYVSHDVRFIRIGCLDENNLVSLNEIKSVVDKHGEITK